MLKLYCKKALKTLNFQNYMIKQKFKIRIIKIFKI